MIGNWVYVALLWSALFAFPGAAKALPEAIRHWNDVKAEHPKRDASAAAGAVLVSLGIMLHALEEIAYKSGRIIQVLQGTDTYDGSSAILIIAGLLGIASLSLAVHYLNRGSRAPEYYWIGQALIAAVFLLL